MESIVPNTITHTESQVRALYDQLLHCWNERKHSAFAELFLDDGYTIGFDGTVSNGKSQINQHLGEVFQHHKTATYVNIIRGIRALNESVWIIHADVGMIPPGSNEINPKLNAVQSLVVMNAHQGLRIALLQNTPAAFHGRPEAVDQLTNELNKTHEQ